MKKILTFLFLALIAIGGATVVFRHWDQSVADVGMAVNVVRSWTAPAGTLTRELSAVPADLSEAINAPAQPSIALTDSDWPSYNRTLTSERFAPLEQINRTNVGRLQVLCSYDTQQHTSFQTGLLMVNGALIGTTEHDIFSLDPATCHENWRVSEAYQPANLQGVNRGAAYMDGVLYRGTEDGRVLAYDFQTGKRIWEASIADPLIGETTPAAPIAWDGLVFIGNAGGDNKGVKGRMYALDGKTGKVVWEFFLVPKSAGDRLRGPQGASPLTQASWQNQPGTPVTGGATWTSYTLDPTSGRLYVPGGNPAPDFAAGLRPGENLYSGSVVVLDAKTGAYLNHFSLVPRDWHDWDVAAAPTLFHSRAGRKMLSVAPKDGNLYGYDLADGRLLYRVPVTRTENGDVPFAVGQSVHFCPGSYGGAEWNGPAYDPDTNLILIGEVDWCNSVTLQMAAKIDAVAPGKPWSGMDSINPYQLYGKTDPFGQWAGWLYAVDADNGSWRWRVKSNYPIMSGMTPTKGGLVLFGDMGGNFYAIDAADGQRLWGEKIGGAIGGGVITYTVGGVQKIAVATGFTSILWPTEVVTAKVKILGLPQ